MDRKHRKWRVKEYVFFVCDIKSIKLKKCFYKTMYEICTDCMRSVWWKRELVRMSIGVLVTGHAQLTDHVVLVISRRCE